MLLATKPRAVITRCRIRQDDVSWLVHLQRIYFEPRFYTISGRLSM
jgi:hypothetical protein